MNRIALAVLLASLLLPLRAQTPFTGDSLPIITLPDAQNIACQIPGQSGVVLVEIWASWCQPCRQRNVELNRILRQLDTAQTDLSKLTVVGVSLDSSKTIWKKAIINDRLHWDVQVIDTGRLNGVVSDSWGVTYLPYNFLVLDGVIRAQSLSGEELKKRLEVLLIR